MNYNDLKSKIKPLDLLLFKGTDFVSKTISKCELYMEGSGSYSHTGIVISWEVMPFLSELEEGKLYIWESTMSGSCRGMNRGGEVPDVETGKGCFGVQIRDLEEVIKHYLSVNQEVKIEEIKASIDEIGQFLVNPNLTDIEKIEKSFDDITVSLREMKKRLNKVKNPKDEAIISWCRLIQNPFPQKSEEICLKLREFHKRYGHRHYEERPLVLMSAVFPKCYYWLKNIDWALVKEDKFLHHLGLKKFVPTEEELDDKSLFCSQFVTLVYQELGIMKEELEACEISPVDLMGHNKKIPYLVDRPINITI